MVIDWGDIISGLVGAVLIISIFHLVMWLFGYTWVKRE